MAIPFLSPDDKMLEILDKGIREYEERYEMPSEDMLKALSDGSERETAEKLRWMFDYRVCRNTRQRNGPARLERLGHLPAHPRATPL